MSIHGCISCKKCHKCSICGNCSCEKDTNISSLESKLKDAGLVEKGLRDGLEYAKKMAKSLENDSLEPDKVIALAGQISYRASVCLSEPSTLSQEIEAKIRAEEREKAAKVADEYKQNCGLSMSRHSTAEYIAQAIRKGGQSG